MSKQITHTDQDNPDQITKLEISNQEHLLRLALMDLEKEAENILEELDKTLQDLILEKTSVIVLVQKLFLYWLMMEASLNKVTQEQVDAWSMPLGESMQRIIDVINKEMDKLPDPPVNLEMTFLGKKLDNFKKYFPAGYFYRVIPLEIEEHIKQDHIVVERLRAVYLSLVKKHRNPKGVSNAFFAYWAHLTTLCAKLSDVDYQEMGFYFDKILTAVQKEVPKLFQNTDINEM